MQASNEQTHHPPVSALRSLASLAPVARLARRATLLAAACVVAAGLAPAAQAQEGPQSLPTINLTAGMYIIHAELATTERERAIGLMFRDSMPQQAGMLFAFEEPGVQCFWMRNTLIPLSAAFIEDDGTIVNIVEMQPRTEDSHCSEKPVRFVLEMNKGWFDKRGFKPGMRIAGAPFGARKP